MSDKLWEYEVGDRVYIPNLMARIVGPYAASCIITERKLSIFGKPYYRCGQGGWISEKRTALLQRQTT